MSTRCIFDPLLRSGALVTDAGSTKHAIVTAARRLVRRCQFLGGHPLAGKVENMPRTRFQDLFGFGLSNKSFQGLPIDSNWLASYLDQGLFGIAVSAAILVFLLMTAFFEPRRSVQRALGMFLTTYCLAAFLPRRASAMRRRNSALRRAGGLAAGLDQGGQPVGMRVMQVHNRYRSAAPSGENRVVDIEGAALAELGHDVVRFERFSDDIETWSGRREGDDAREGGMESGEPPASSASGCASGGRECAVYVHNTFPLLSVSVLYACRDAGVPVVATLHNYKLACASGGFSGRARSVMTARTGHLCPPCGTAVTATRASRPRRSR